MDENSALSLSPSPRVHVAPVGTPAKEKASFGNPKPASKAKQSKIPPNVMNTPVSKTMPPRKRQRVSEQEDMQGNQAQFKRIEENRAHVSCLTQAS